MTNTIQRAVDASRHAFTLLAMAAVALSLSACGAGGADDGETISLQAPSIGSALRITTTTMPPASRGVSYESAALTASGASGSVTWTLGSGTLPPGITLASNGRISGTPVATGFYQFTASAQDAAAVAHQPLVISVDTFGVAVSSGLHFGDAWSGRPVTLQCAGFDHMVSFEATVNDSGGSFIQLDGAAGRAVWLPGPNNNPGSQDVIRADCGVEGGSAEVTLDIAPDTTAGHTADFQSSDVWYLEFETKRGSHPFATDWHAALARLGLRTSTSAAGTEADRLAELVTRVSVLRRINEMFLRNTDGSAGANGLAISFPLERPGTGYATPVPGGLAPAAGNLFNVMSISDELGTLSAYGVAITDTVGNPRVENNSNGALGQLGTFVNHIAETVQNTFRLHGNGLRVDPINEDDIPALKAILYNRGNPGGRYEMIKYYAEALGEAIAYITAHETGHSLGLGHTYEYTPGSIMNTVGIISPSADHFFLAEDLAKLRAGLPGGGRITGAQKVSAVQMAAVTVCRGQCHGEAGHEDHGHGK